MSAPKTHPQAPPQDAPKTPHAALPPGVRVHAGTLADLSPDPANANAGTERGTGMLEDSLQAYGAGRSLLVDRHGVIIAGNKTGQKAGEIGLEDVIVVHTNGSQLVVVQRDDLDMADPDDTRARLLAVADNAIGEANLEWDADVLRRMAEEDGLPIEPLFTPREWSRLMDSVAHTATDPAEAETASAGETPLLLNEDVIAYWRTHYERHGHCVICGGDGTLTGAEADLHCICPTGQTQRLTHKPDTDHKPASQYAAITGDEAWTD